MKPDAAIEAELIEVLERFCSGFADRDVEAVIRLFAPDPGVVVVTSEESLLRGPAELRRFLDRYADGLLVGVGPLRSLHSGARRVAPRRGH